MRPSHGARRRGPARRGRARHEAEAAAAAAALTGALCEAYLAGDPVALARALGPDVHVVIDCGGDTSLPVAAGVAPAAALVRRVLGEPASLELAPRPMNGRWGLVASRDGCVIAVVVPTGAIGAVDHLWIVADPAKLGHWRS